MSRQVSEGAPITVGAVSKVASLLMRTAARLAARLPFPFSNILRAVVTVRYSGGTSIGARYSQLSSAITCSPTTVPGIFGTPSLTGPGDGKQLNIRTSSHLAMCLSVRTRMARSMSFTREVARFSAWKECKMLPPSVLQCSIALGAAAPTFAGNPITCASIVIFKKQLDIGFI